MPEWTEKDCRENGSLCSYLLYLRSRSIQPAVNAADDRSNAAVLERGNKPRNFDQLRKRQASALFTQLQVIRPSFRTILVHPFPELKRADLRQRVIDIIERAAENMA